MRGWVGIARDGLFAVNADARLVFVSFSGHKEKKEVSFDG